MSNLDPRVQKENSDAIEICVLLSEQKEILWQIIHCATEPPGKVNAKADLAKFLLLHALNIHEVAKAALLLMSGKEPYGVALLARSALESTFCLVAAMQDREFGPQRIAFELEELAKKLKLLMERGAWPVSRHPTPDECRLEAERIRSEYSAPVPSDPDELSRVKIIERIAQVADLSPFYEDDYRQLSLAVHSNQAGMLNAASGFLVRKGMLTLCNAVFFGSNVITTAFRVRTFEAEMKNHRTRLEKYMERPDYL